MASTRVLMKNPCPVRLLLEILTFREAAMPRVSRSLGAVVEARLPEASLGEHLASSWQLGCRLPRPAEHILQSSQ